jgi:hypothetical protein
MEGQKILSSEMVVSDSWSDTVPFPTHTIFFCISALAVKPTKFKINKKLFTAITWWANGYFLFPSFPYLSRPSQSLFFSPMPY